MIQKGSPSSERIFLSNPKTGLRKEVTLFSLLNKSYITSVYVVNIFLREVSNLDSGSNRV